MKALTNILRFWFCHLLFTTLFTPNVTIGQIQTNGAVIGLDSLDSTYQPFYLKHIHIVGNKKTRRQIITRELSVTQGDSVTVAFLKGNLDYDRNRIYNTNLFNTVDLTVLQTDSTTIDLMIKVTERWYFYPGVIIKGVDRNINDWIINREGDLGRINYGLSLNQYNVRGMNERLRVIAQAGFIKHFNVAYKFPYIDKAQKHGLSFSGGYAFQNSVPYTTIENVPRYYTTENREVVRKAIGASMTYTLRNSFYHYHNLTTDFLRSIVDDSVIIMNPNYFENGESQQTFLQLAYSWVQDKRDNVNYPNNGSHIYILGQKVGLGIFNDVDLWRFRVNISKYTDLGKGWYLSNNIGGLITTPKNQPYFNYSSLGFGSFYVRGFELDLVEGHQLLVTKHSLRKRLFKHVFDISKVMPLTQFDKIPLAIYPKIFADAGWANSYPNFEGSSPLTDKFLYGIGLGIDFVTVYDVVFRFEYSFNSNHKFNDFYNFRSEF